MTLETRLDWQISVFFPWRLVEVWLVVLYVEGGGALFLLRSHDSAGPPGVYYHKVYKFLVYFGIRTSQDMVFVESIIWSGVFVQRWAVFKVHLG